MKKTVLVVLAVIGLILWAQGFVMMVRADHVLWADTGIDVTDINEWVFEVDPDPPPHINITALEARIAKLEAELRRTAALVYAIHGDGHWVDVVSPRGFVGESNWKPLCNGTFFLSQPEIDECLANVTIEEGK